MKDEVDPGVDAYFLFYETLIHFIHWVGRILRKFIFSKIKKRRKPKVKIVTIQLCEVKKIRS